MFARLFLLLTLFPLLEIALLVWIASKTSVLFVLGMLVATGVLGTWLARHQGFHAWRRIAAETEQGRMPADSLVDGFLILLAAGLLILPGFLSDVAAILLLVPSTRRAFKGFFARRFRARVVTAHFGDARSSYDHAEIIDVKVIDSPPGHLPH